MRLLKLLQPPTLGLMNGDVGLTVLDARQQLRVIFAKAGLILPDHPSPLLTRELAYTAITRAKAEFTLLGAKAGRRREGRVGRRRGWVCLQNHPAKFLESSPTKVSAACAEKSPFLRRRESSTLPLLAYSQVLLNNIYAILNSVYPLRNLLCQEKATGSCLYVAAMIVFQRIHSS